MSSFTNLFEQIPTSNPEELFHSLLATNTFKLERIVSFGQTSPEGFWYDQPLAEWVVLLKGGATIQIEGEPQPRQLAPGDILYLPAHQRHRVESTSTTEPTVWLALHYNA